MQRVGVLHLEGAAKAQHLLHRVGALDPFPALIGGPLLGQEGDLRSEVLLEINTSGEEAKFGFDLEHIDAMLTCVELPGLKVQGLMTIGPLTQDTERIRKAFVQLRKLFNSLNSQLPANIDLLTELSMGMSGDFEIAIEEGSTMVRLGTILFGPRQPYE